MNVTKTLIIIALCPLFVLSSCKEEILHKGKTPLVSVGKEFLYKEDVQRFYAANHPAGDSAQFVGEYIEHWIEEALFYSVAQRNIPSTGDVEKLVESYKRSLVLNLYQEGLVEQHLRPEVQPEKIEAFYNENASMFELEEPILKGLFLKVPVGAQKLNNLRKWYKSRDIEDLEKLDKYSLANDVVYDHFTDSWERLSAIASKTTITEGDLLYRLLHNSHIEFKDKEYIYFVSADSVINKGALKPIELVESEIRSLLINTMKANFIKGKKQDIYNEAQKVGAIKYYE